MTASILTLPEDSISHTPHPHAPGAVCFLSYLHGHPGVSAFSWGCWPPNQDTATERDCKPRTWGDLTQKVAFPIPPLDSCIKNWHQDLPSPHPSPEKTQKSSSSVLAGFSLHRPSGHLHSIYCYISPKPSEGNTLTFNNTPWMGVEIHRCQPLLSVYT